jgi:hypothetical protein
VRSACAAKLQRQDNALQRSVAVAACILLPRKYAPAAALLRVAVSASVSSSCDAPCKVLAAANDSVAQQSKHL